MRHLLFAFASAATFMAALASPAQAQISRQGGPIDITADSTEFVSDENVNRWVGRVNVRQGDARLLADRMDVFFTPGTDGQPRVIERIEATGSVAYVTPLEIARGDRGVYLATTEKIRLTGNVTLIRGDSTLSGEELIIEPSVGRSSLVSSAGARGERGGERVRGVFSSASAPADPEPEEEPSTDPEPEPAPEAQVSETEGQP